MEKTYKRKVLIVEGNPDGHRLSYVALLASAAHARGDHAILATSDYALRSDEWGIHLGTDTSNELSIIGEFTLDGIASKANELAVDHVVIPDGDQFVYRLARGQRWTGRGTLTILVMREKGQPLDVPGAALLTTFIKGVLLLVANRRSRVEVRVLKSATWRGFSLLPVSRDPVVLTEADDDVLPPAARQLTQDYFWFGVVGKVGWRKNLPLVAASIAALNRSDVGLLVAGEIEPGILAQAHEHLERIRQCGGRVETIDRLLSDLEMDQIIKRLDCVVLAHSNEGPSGILGKAVLAGTRIVAAGAASLRKDCQHVGSGAEWAKMKEKAITAALARSMTSPPPAVSGVASADEFTSDLLSRTP